MRSQHFLIFFQDVIVWPYPEHIIVFKVLFVDKVHHFVVITSEVDIVMFNRSLVWYSYVYSAVITIVFAVLINILMHFKIRRIDEVESLKSIE